jgi:hypothetical protein
LFYSARIKITVCDASKVETLLKNVDQCGDLKYIIKIGDNVTEEEQERAKEHGVEIVTFSDIEVSRKYLIKTTFTVLSDGPWSFRRRKIKLRLSILFICLQIQCIF